jgi:myo-inositol 2-dehydrogenase/D-chiro-inositol 1-dehydrogenase
MSDTEHNDPRVCVVGAGGHATRCLYPFLGKAGAQLVGVCDLDLSKAATNARRFGGKPYTDLDAMLDAEAPDAVMVCVGPEQHAPLASAVLRRGVPVYTEKPPAARAADALAVARLAAEKDLLCTTAFKKRYSNAYSRARRWLDELPAGEGLRAFSADYCSAPYRNTSPRDSFLLDFTIHLIDLTQYLAGDAEQVFCFTRDAHDYAVSLRFTSGAVGTLTLSDGRSFSVPTEEVELTAGGGRWMTVHNSSVWRISGPNGVPAEWREPPTFTSQGDSGNETGHWAEIADFVAALREGRRTTRSQAYESYKSMVLYEAIDQSARTGTVVPVHYETL